MAQLDLVDAFSVLGGNRFFTGLVMIIHMFFAELFVGFAIAAPVLQAWGARTGSPRMDRLAHSMARFNVLTFSTGATFAVLFLVLLVGFYPRVTAALFTHFFWFFPVLAMTAMLLTVWLFYVHYYRAKNRAHPINIAAGLAAAFFILLWQVILSGIDQFMLTGGEVAGQGIQGGGISSPLAALSNLFSATSIPMDLHRTF